MVDRRSILAAVLMASASGMAALRVPTRKIADQLPPLNLDTIAPLQLGAWKVNDEVVPLLASPDLEQQMARIYSQTLARTYQDGNTSGVMLVIAYGRDQADATTQLHQPELCYAAQGFEVARRGSQLLRFPGASLPVVRLFAHRRERQEPITYWTTVSDQALNTETDRRLARARYALRGEIPDGMLVRISSIDADESRAFDAHHRFISAWLGTTDPKVKPRIFGRSA